MRIYNGEGMLLGRLASRIAKDALLGEEVKVINCDKIIVSGKKTSVFANEKVRRLRKGYPLKSQKRPRFSERYVRRAIRGMLPWDTTRGREAFDRIMCYVGSPEEIKGDAIVLEDASVKKLPNVRYVTVKDIVLAIGGKE